MRINSNDLNYLKDILVQWQDEISKDSDRDFKKLAEVTGNLPDLVDRAHFDSERWTTINKLTRKRMDKHKINKSLHKIENGLYGTCERCGEEISVERLKARPLTSYCIECKAEMENEENLIHSER
jgi:DnaK suppressor protein